MIDKVLGVEVPAGKRGMVGFGDFAQAVDTLEHAVSAPIYITGDRFTAADVYVGSAVGWFTQFGLLEKREAFMRYLDRLHERPAMQRAAAIDDALLGMPLSDSGVVPQRSGGRSCPSGCARSARRTGGSDLPFPADSPPLRR